MVLLLITFSSCLELDECSTFNPGRCIRNYRIEIPFEVTNDTFSYSVGDTFEIKIVLADSILDLNENVFIDISNYNYQVNFHSRELDLQSKELLFTNSENFDYFETDIGSLDIPSASIIFERVDNRRECVFKVKCNRPGIFYGNMNYQTNNLDEQLGNRPILDFTETCCREILEVNNTLTNNIENRNFHLINNDLSGWDGGTVNTDPLDFDRFEFTSTGYYLFEVVE